MSARYTGPLRAEPISIELHNTLFATSAGRVDGLADRASRDAFLRDIAPRISDAAPPAAEQVDVAGLLELRRLVRSALHATLDQQPHNADELEALNRFAARAPTSIRAELAPHDQGPPLPDVDHHGASPSAITLAAFASDAIELITGPHPAELRACGAPGCMLIYLANDPRRRWCSDACGNRARQARHYQRTRAAP
jgi:predicted RNA-binding Zn ribbon-like protein